MKNGRREFLAAALLASLALPPGAAAADAAVDFDREIRPILSDNCFACHGPDENKRKAGRRLDTREGILATKDGVAAVVPGQSDASAVIQRAISHDPDEVMPPPKPGKQLTPAQIEKLRHWIDQGADWQGRWAFERPVRSSPLVAIHSC